MRHTALLSLALSVALLPDGCGSGSSPSSNANDKFQDAGNAAAIAVPCDGSGIGPA